MAIPRNEGDLDHIEVVREPIPEKERARRKPPPPPPAPDRGVHAQALSEAAEVAWNRILSSRTRLGVEGSRLFSVSMASSGPSPRDEIEERIGARVVHEEVRSREEGNEYQMVVQFPHAGQFQALQHEVLRYAEDQETEAGSIPRSVRNKLFDSLEGVGTLSRSDRIGPRLEAAGGRLNAPGFLDVDLWHPGSRDDLEWVLDTFRSLCERHGGRVVEDFRTSSLILLKVRGDHDTLEAILESDLVSSVDLPPQFTSVAMGELLNHQPVGNIRHATQEDALVCLLDSGVVAGHPLLQGWIDSEHDFGSGEGTPVDQHGHGTQIAGLLVYGDVASCVESGEWNPLVRVFSAKVMRRHPVFGHAVVPEEHRVEGVIESAIRYAHSARGCKVFNVSIGDEAQVYRGGRQFPLAEKLDELARELGVVIVVAAGNRSDIPVPTGQRTRAEVQREVANRLLDEANRVCNPATAALALTVGSVARSEALDDGAGVSLRGGIAGSPRGAPSPFSRSGPGYQSRPSRAAIKPEVIHFGGNRALDRLGGPELRWRDHILVGEPTLRHDFAAGGLLTAVAGTSYAAPHVASLAATASRALATALRRDPSSNLVRAVLGAATEPPACPPDVLGDEEAGTRKIGYGIPKPEAAWWSTDGSSILVSEDSVLEDNLVLFRVPVPPSFVNVPGSRGICISLAFDPPVRASRSEYLARTMWFDLYQGLPPAELLRAIERGGRTRGHRLPDGAKLDLRPTKSAAAWSTLQVRRKSWVRAPRFRVTEDGSSDLHLVVGCQKRFNTGLEPAQSYAIAIRFWHSGQEVRLYQELRASVRIAQPVRATGIRV